MNSLWIELNQNRLFFYSLEPIIVTDDDRGIRLWLESFVERCPLNVIVSSFDLRSLGLG